MINTRTIAGVCHIPDRPQCTRGPSVAASFENRFIWHPVRVVFAAIDETQALRPSHHSPSPTVKLRYGSDTLPRVLSSDSYETCHPA